MPKHHLLKGTQKALKTYKCRASNSDFDHPHVMEGPAHVMKHFEAQEVGSDRPAFAKRTANWSHNHRTKNT